VKNIVPDAKQKKQSTKISFQGDFYSDLTMDNMLYGAIVRSPAKTGIITSISHGNLPDGYYLFTARDVPGSNLIDTPLGKVPVFSEGNISYFGEPLGILVGPDEDKVYELLSEIEIVFDTNTIESYLKSFEEEYKRPVLSLPGSNDSRPNAAEIVEITKAMNLDAAPLSADSIVREHENAEKYSLSNKLEQDMFSSVIAHRSIEKGPCFVADGNGVVPGLKSVFNNASFVVEGSWFDALHTPAYTEPNGAICTFSGEYLTVYTPTQWLSNIRQVLSTALAVNPEKILIKKTNTTNHGTNSIWYNSIIACQAATAAFHTGKSVKLVYSRDEQEKFMETMLPITIAHKTALDASGKILAMQVNIDLDAGSSNPFAQEILDRLVIASCGCYNPLNMSVSATAFRSANPSSSIDLQLIDTAAFFAVENQLNEISLLSGLTPAEIRKVNIMQSNGDRCSMPFAFTIEKPSELIDALVKVSDFNRKYASYHLDAVLRSTQSEASLFEAPLRGIGLSCGFEGSGYYGSGIYSSDETMEVTLETDGTLTIHSPPTSASIKEIWEQTVSKLLNIPPESVRINSEFDSHEEPFLPESIYCNISIMTVLLKKCCESILRKRSDAVLPLTVKKSITAAQKMSWNSETFSGTPFHSTSFASGCVEVELDPCTFREHIRGIWVVINGGQILSARAAESTVKLCIQKVLASLVCEEAISCSNIHVSFMQSESDATQIGELVYQVLPAAYTQALTQALGCTINTLPLRTDTLYNRICDKTALEKARILSKTTAKRAEDLDKNEFELQPVSKRS